MRTRQPGTDDNTLRTKVLEASTIQFARLGYYGARIDDIAKESGVNKRKIYFFFESKEGLYEAVLRAQVEIIKNLPDFGVCKECDFKTNLEKVVRGHFNFYKEHVMLTRVVVWELMLDAEKQISVNVKPDILRLMIGQFREAFQIAGEKGELNPQIDDEKVKFLLLMMHGAMFNYLFRSCFDCKSCEVLLPQDSSDEAFVEFLIQRLMIDTVN